MANEPSVKIGGLWRNGNPLDAPEGSLSEALNVWHPAKNALEPRRGFQEQITLAASGTLSMAAYEDKLVLMRRGLSNKFSVNTAAKAGGAETSVLTGLTEVTSLVRPKTAIAGKNLYLNALEGVQRMSGSTAVPVLAGAPKATGFVEATPTGLGWLDLGKAVAYRSVFVTMDAFDRLYLGSPSGRIVANNGVTTTSNIQVTVLVPSWVTTDSFLRVYRTAEVLSTIDPGDEMALVHEIRVTSQMIADGTYTFTDITPSEMRGATLYTNPNSGQGILQANEPPPAAVDLTLWNNRLWFLNTTRLHSLSLELLGVGVSDGVSGIRDGDTVTIGAYTLSGGTANPALDNFEVYTASSSAAENIRRTAMSFVDIVNRGSARNTYRAFYASGPDDAPGKIIIEAASPSTPQFFVTSKASDFPVTEITRLSGVVTIKLVTSGDTLFRKGETVVLSTGNVNFPAGAKVLTSVSGVNITYNEAGANATWTPTAPRPTVTRTITPAGSAWSPALPVSGTDIASDNEAAQNRLYYSKLDEFEAVPRLNYMDIGDPTAKGLRIKALRDRLYVFKEDGVFVVSGEAPFRSDLFDPTARLVFPDSLDVVDNQIYGAFDLGVCSVSEGGVRVVSGAIQDVIDTEYRSIVRTGSTANAAFGAGDSVEHRYVVWMPSGAAYVYNARLGLWTQWTLAAETAYADKGTGALWIASGTSVSREGDPTDRYSYMDTKKSPVGFIPYLFNGSYYLVSDVNSASHGAILGSQAASDLLGLKPDSYVFDPGSNGYVRVIGYATRVNYPTVPGLAVGIAYEGAAPVGGTFEKRPIGHTIPVRVTWLPAHQGVPDQAKQFREVRYSFQDVPPVYLFTGDYGANGTVKGPNASFASDVTSGVTDLPFITETVGSLYFPTYPQTSRARSHQIPHVYCAQVPQDHAFSTFLETGFSFAMPFCYWRLVGRSLVFEQGADYP